MIDPAFLRPGRFGNLVYVPLPNADDRVSILKSIANKRPLDPSVDLDAIANKYCEGFSGADLANLVNLCRYKCFLIHKTTPMFCTDGWFEF